MEEKNTFLIKKKLELSKNDNLLLLYLYYPIIGDKAYMLYIILITQYFIFELNVKYNLNIILTLLQISYKNFLIIKNKLKKIDLLKIMKHKKEKYLIFEPKLPISAISFFNKKKFSDFLLNILGKEYFLFIKNKFIVDNKKYINYNNGLFNKLNNNKFLFDFVYINKYLYNKNIVKPANMLEVKINEMISIDPIQYLTLLQENKKPTIIEIELIRDLILNYSLTPGVVNCLIEYVWFKNMHRIERKYCEKIANTFCQLQINTVNKAMKHLRNAYIKTKNNKIIKNNLKSKTHKYKDKIINNNVKMIELKYNEIYEEKCKKQKNKKVDIAQLLDDLKKL